MGALTSQLVGLGLAAVTAVLVLAGGVIFFTVGRARGVLAGIGFVVLGIGVLASFLLSFASQMIISRTGFSPTTMSAAVTLVSVVINAVGWGLVIAAMLRLRAERTGAAPAYPGAGPYGYGPPEYGQPPYGRPPYGPPSGAPYGGTPPAPPGPGWGHPASGPEGPPPPGV